MVDPRVNKLAKVMVHYSTGIKPGQLVRISGPTVTEPLVVELYREVLLAGAYPAVDMFPEEIEEIRLKHGSDEQLKYITPMTWTLVDKIDASFRLLGTSNSRSLSNCDPDRQAIASAALKQFRDKFFKRAASGELKWCLTQYPCDADAQDAEMSLSEYEDFVYTAGLLNEPDPAEAWKKVAARQQRLIDYLMGKKEVHITTPQGTDVRFSVDGRTWINCCGHENFPDGEVFTGPVEDSTQGTIAFSFPASHGGREVNDIVLTFKNGKVVDAHASRNEAYLIKMLDQDPGARILGELAFGCNYSITRYTKNTLFDEKIGGTFHTAVGSGYPETGAKNQSGLHWDMVCDLHQGGKIVVDGKTISENGKFTDPQWPGN